MASTGKVVMKALQARIGHRTTACTDPDSCSVMRGAALNSHGQQAGFTATVSTSGRPGHRWETMKLEPALPKDHNMCYAAVVLLHSQRLMGDELSAHDEDGDNATDDMDHSSSPDTETEGGEGGTAGREGAQGACANARRGLRRSV